MLSYLLSDICDFEQFQGPEILIKSTSGFSKLERNRVIIAQGTWHGHCLSKITTDQEFFYFIKITIYYPLKCFVLCYVHCNLKKI